MRHLKCHRHHVRGVAYSPDGKWLASASNDRTVCLIDLGAGKVVQKWDDFTHVMTCVAFSPSGKTLAVAGHGRFLYLRQRGESFEETIKLPFRHRRDTFFTSSSVAAVAFSPDGSRLLVATGDRHSRGYRGVLHLYHCCEEDSYKLEREEMIDDGVWAGCFSPDGKRIALGTGLGYRLCTIEPWFPGPFYTQKAGGMAVAWSPDGQTVALGMGWSVVLRNLNSTAGATLKGHKGMVTSLAFTPDGRRLLSGSWDQNVRVWDPATARDLGALDWRRGKVQHLAVAPDGMTAAAGCDRGIVVWDLDE